MIAAGHAADLGASVVLLEKMNRPGRKLGITGKGRCNISNNAPLDLFIEKIKPDGRFLRSAFSTFFSEDIVEYMNLIGVETQGERGGRIFPANGSAPEIVRKMERWLAGKKVTVVTNTRAKNLIINESKIKGVVALTGKSGSRVEKRYHSNSVLIATGGLSYPATGSTGDGYRLAESADHTITPLLPSLVPLESSCPYLSILSGLEMKNIKVTVFVDNKKRDEEFGEMLFTSFGISGPIVLSLSREIVSHLEKKQRVEISIDLKPALDFTKLDNRIVRDLNSRGKEELNSILRGLLPPPLVDVALKDTKLSGYKKGNQVNSAERRIMAEWLKGFRIAITGYRSYKESIITSGGVDLNEVNQRSMESKLVKGLYFAGEVLNLDAPTGGYNLQIAFSTGWVAAEGIFKE